MKRKFERKFSKCRLVDTCKKNEENLKENFLSVGSRHSLKKMKRKFERKFSKCHLVDTCKKNEENLKENFLSVGSRHLLKK